MDLRSDLKEVISSRLSSIKVQDVALVILCALVIYLFRVRDEHMISPQWRYHFSSDKYPNGRSPVCDQRLPLPVVTDLESDGISEVVIVSSAGQLEVHILPPGGDVAVLPHLEVKTATQLPAGLAPHGHGVPVAMEAGFLTPYNSEDRKQVIVVMLDDWTVLCYDNDLQLLWHRHLMNLTEAHSDYYMKSVAVLVTSTQVARGDRGLVVVGASYAHKHGHVHQTKTRPIEELGVRGVHPAKQHRAHVDSQHVEQSGVSLAHFSTFGLSGTDGTVRWHHLPGDFKSTPAKERPVPHWKLGLRRNLGHIGEEAWQRYNHDLSKQMPYSWGSMFDTRMELAKINKNRRTQLLEKPAAADSSTTAQDLLGLSAEHLIGAAYGGMKPHSRHEHVQNPNVIVTHHDQGLEVLSLTTGTPVTCMQFMDEKAVFADVNGDGNLERIKANFEDDSCQAEVTTLQPALTVLYSGKLCESPSLWGALSLADTFYSDTEVSEDTHVALAPVVVKSVARRASLTQHLLGHSLPSQRLGSDTVYMTSTGRLTSFAPNGEFNWQVKVAAGWSEIAHAVQTGSFAGSESQEVFKTSFHPSITPFAHQIYGEKNLLLVVGWAHVTVVSLIDGQSLADHSLPCQPTAPPVLGDYNNDGYNDIIITCAGGYFGFLLQSKPNYVYMSLVSVTVVLTILLLTWCFRPEEPSGEDWKD